MFSEPSTQSPADARQTTLNWYRIWFHALARPSLSTYEDIANLPQASVKSGYLWVAITGAVSAIIPLLLGDPQQKFYVWLVCVLPFFVVCSLLAVGLITGCTHWIARLLGGTSSYAKLVYVFSAFSAPMTIVSGALFFLPFGKWLNAIGMFYWIAITIMTVKALYKLSWGKAVFSSFALILLSVFSLVATVVMPNPA